MAFLASNALHRINGSLSNTTGIVQGCGNVGSHAAATLLAYGVRIVGLSDASGGLRNAGGIDIAALRAHVAEHKTIQDFPSAGAIHSEVLLKQFWNRKTC